MQLTPEQAFGLMTFAIGVTLVAIFFFAMWLSCEGKRSSWRKRAIEAETQYHLSKLLFDTLMEKLRK